MSKTIESVSSSLQIGPEIFSKISAFYLFVQFVIWAKVGVFFFFTGAGQSPAIFSYSMYLNPAEFLERFASFDSLERFDVLFHQAMHFLIALTVFAFARHSPKAEFFLLLKIFTLAAILHNVGYWLTKVFPTAELLLFDFVTDIAALFFFYYIFRWFNGFGVVKKIRISLLA